MKWFFSRGYSTQARYKVRISQKNLVHALNVLFPDYRGIFSTVSNSFLELDMWIPALKIAFEFQDPHHYASASYAVRPFDVIKRNDDMKVQAMEDRGATLIHVPFWWDGQIESLIETIRERRPELVKNFKTQDEPIPPEPPTGVLKIDEVPGIGEAMTATFVLRATHFDGSWWMSEKYDGIRAFWNPTTRTLIGKQIPIMGQFKNHFPRIFLDGELWVGRGEYKYIQTILDRPSGVPWSFLRYLPFDSPSPSLSLSSSSSPSSPSSSSSSSSLSLSSLSSAPLEARHSLVHLNVPIKHPFMIVIGMKEFSGQGPMHREAQMILNTGGEGVIARKANSIYFHGRFVDFVKLKAARDLEGLVLAEYTDNTFDIRLPNDETVNAKLIPSMESEKPKAGDVVTLAYERFTHSGNLVTPRIVRIRTDLEWDDVASNLKKSPNSLGYRSLGREDQQEEEEDNNKKISKNKKTIQAKGHWTIEGSKNVRIFFDNFCRERNKDPLDPQSWYSIRIRDIVSTPSGGSVLKHYGGSVVKALMDVYPSLHLDPIDFDHMLHRYWQKFDNRRRFFENVAKRLDFNPLLPSNWYPLTAADYSLEKGYNSLLAFYRGSMSKALIDVYPDIGIDALKFRNVSRRFWRTSINRKRFFDLFARKRNFDPLVADNWYDTSRNVLLAEKGGVSIMVRHYNCSLAQALRDVYPTIKMDSSRFADALGTHFHSVANRRKFFEEHAKKKNFDPLVADGWYLFSEKDINLETEGKHVLSRYSGKLYLALSSLFPEILFHEENFKT